MTTAKRRKRRPSAEAAMCNIVVVSDEHAGCQMGLCPPRVPLDGGGYYEASPLQRRVHAYWQEFWRDFVPVATRGEPFVVVLNGDAMDGVHHRATTQVSQNMADQLRIARTLLEPVRDACDGRLWMVRGTEAHVGPSAEHEEKLARMLGAIERGGNHSHFELVLELPGEKLCHFTHHIATSASPFTRTSALLREVVNHYVEVGKWGDKPYSVIVRGHRHTHDEITHQSVGGKVTVFTTGAWQLKTPYVYRIGARIAQPEVGGSVIRIADGELFTRHFIKRLEQPRGERV